jgi:hypothetical protein
MPWTRRVIWFIDELAVRADGLKAVMLDDNGLAEQQAKHERQESGTT